MIDIYQRRSKKYTEDAQVLKAVVDNNGRSLYHDTGKSIHFKCQDNGFETVTLRVNGHSEKITKGEIETIDLKDGDISPDDAILYNGVQYLIETFKFADFTKSKQAQLHAPGKTTIEVRK